ncbi:MAG: MarR family transcriptional regulator [Acidimicrobiales bacterium]
MMPDPERKMFFGDLLAQARERWIRAMAQRLASRGFNDYRRSDPLVMRSLRSGEVSLGNVGVRLGVTRQAARKVINGLVERGYARVTTSKEDSRRRNVELTPRGREYLEAVVATLRSMHDDVVDGVDGQRLDAAYSVLEFVRDRFRAEASREDGLVTRP